MRIGQELGEDGAVGNMDGRDGDLLVLVVGNAAQLQPGLLDPLFIGKIEMLAHRAAVAGNDFEVVQHLLSLVGELGAGLGTTRIDKHRSHFQQGFGMEIAGGVGHGDVHGYLLADQRKHFGGAVHADPVGHAHLLEPGLGTRNGRCRGSEQQEDF